MLLPREHVSNFSEMLIRDGSILSLNEKCASVSHECGAYFCKQVDGVYPNYAQVIPSKKVLLGEVLVSDVKSLLGRCLHYSAAVEANGAFSFTAEKLTVDFIGDNNAKLSHHIEGKFAPFKIALNIRSLHKVFSQLNGDKATIYSGGDELKPFTVQNEQVSVLTMPMRFNHAHAL
jgi:DNA polymerase III sliding clamp (beta) subunit (PCNA family)